MAHIHAPAGGKTAEKSSTATKTAPEVVVTVDSRRAAFGRLAPEYANLIKKLPDEALARETAPDIFARLRTAAGHMQKAEAALCSADAAPHYSAAHKALTAPVKPKPQPLRVTDAERAEYERLIHKAETTPDRYLSQGYRARAEDLVKGKIL